MGGSRNNKVLEQEPFQEGSHWKRGKGPHPQTLSLAKKIARFTKGRFSSSLRTEKHFTTRTLHIYFTTTYIALGKAIFRP